MFFLIGLTNLKENLNEDRAKQAKKHKNAKTKRWLEDFFLYFGALTLHWFANRARRIRNRTFVFGNRAVFFKGEIIRSRAISRKVVLRKGEG